MITIALSKGYLLQEALDLFGKIGIEAKSGFEVMEVYMSKFWKMITAITRISKTIAATG